MDSKPAAASGMVPRYTWKTCQAHESWNLMDSKLAAASGMVPRYTDHSARHLPLPSDLT
jgi:hypothetical protein